MNDILISRVNEAVDQQKRNENLLSKVQFTTSVEMLKKGYPELTYLWQGILPDAGLAICAASKASGKTLLMLQLAESISRGVQFLGIPTRYSKVLFIELELSESRMDQRLRKMGIIRTENLIFSCNSKDKQWPQGQNGIETLKAAIEHFKARFIVIDVLARLWPQSVDLNSYQDSYNTLGPLRQLAYDLGVMIMMVTHNRKMEAADYIDSIMGSVGIAGSADVILSLQKKRGKSEAVLFIEGNDIESRKIALNFNNEPLGFSLSDASPEEMRQTPERREIMEAIRKLGGSAKTGQIAELVGKDKSNISHILQKMVSDGSIISSDYGTYCLLNTVQTIQTIQTSSNNPTTTLNTLNRLNTLELTFEEKSDKARVRQFYR